MNRAIQAQGVTLLELMLSIAVLMILLMVAVPSMQSFLATNKVRVTRDKLVSSIARAHQESIRYHVPAYLCPSSDATSCSSAWSGQVGWLVFTDNDRDSVLDEDEIILIEVSSSNLATITSDNVSMKFLSSGHTEESVFVVSDSSGSAYDWKVTVNIMGSVSSAVCTTTDGSC
jgi:type IV fimbrial biogenesis protein FimT